jgi:hypothetical protein
LAIRIELDVDLAPMATFDGTRAVVFLPPNRAYIQAKVTGRDDDS